jgi:hypothetical protein
MSKTPTEPQPQPQKEWRHWYSEDGTILVCQPGTYLDLCGPKQQTWRDEVYRTDLLEGRGIRD